MADDNQVQQRFTPIGIRMRNFGRRIVRHYAHESSANITPPPQKPQPSWLSNTQMPLVWSQSAAQMAQPQQPAEDMPAENIVDAQTMIQRAERPTRVQRQPQQQSPAPTRSRKPGDKWSPDTDAAVLKIWELHKDNMREREEIRRKKRENFMESASEDVSFRTRKRRAEVDYLETSALVDPVQQPRETRTPQNDDQVASDSDEGSSPEGGSPDISLMRDADTTDDNLTIDAPFAEDISSEFPTTDTVSSDAQIQRAEAFDSPDDTTIDYSEDAYYEDDSFVDDDDALLSSNVQTNATPSQPVSASDSPTIQRMPSVESDADSDDQPQAAEFVGEPSEAEWEELNVPTDYQTNESDSSSAQAAIDQVQSTSNSTPIQRETFIEPDQPQQAPYDDPVQDDFVDENTATSQPQPAQWQPPNAPTNQTPIQRSIEPDTSPTETNWQSDVESEYDNTPQPSVDTSPTPIQRDYVDADYSDIGEADVVSGDWQAAPPTSETSPPIQRDFDDTDFSEPEHFDRSYDSVDTSQSQPMRQTSTDTPPTTIQRSTADDGDYSDIGEADVVSGDWQAAPPTAETSPPIQRDFDDAAHADFDQSDVVSGEWQPPQQTSTDVTAPIQRDFDDADYSDFDQPDVVSGDWQPQQASTDVTAPIQRDYDDAEYADFDQPDVVSGEWQPSQASNDVTPPIQRDYGDAAHADFDQPDVVSGEWQPPQTSNDVITPIQRDFDVDEPESASGEWYSQDSIGAFEQPIDAVDNVESQWQPPQADATPTNQIQRSVEPAEFFEDAPPDQPALSQWRDDAPTGDIAQTASQQPTQPVRAEWQPRESTFDSAPPVSDSSRTIQRAVYEPASSFQDDTYVNPSMDYPASTDTGTSADSPSIQRSVEPANAAWTPQDADLAMSDNIPAHSQPISLDEALASMPGWGLQSVDSNVSSPAPTSDSIQRQTASTNPSVTNTQSDADGSGTGQLPQNTLDLYQALLNEGAIQESQEPVNPPSFSGDVDMGGQIMRAIDDASQSSRPASQPLDWSTIESVQPSQGQPPPQTSMPVSQQAFAPSPQIMRDSEITEPNVVSSNDADSDDNDADNDIDVGKLARDVYKVLRNKLRVERERRKR